MQKSSLPSWLRALLAFFLSTGLVQAGASEANAADLTAGPQVTIRQVLNEDVFIKGGVATIEGTVNGRVYAENARVLVSGTIAGDLVATGGEIEIAPGARLLGRLLTQATLVTIRGHVPGTAQPDAEPIALGNPAKAFTQDSLAVYQEGRLILVKIADIFFASAHDDETWLHTVQGNFKTRFTLKALEQRLAGAGFFRVHRSYLVNLGYICEVSAFTRDSFNLTLNDSEGSQIPLSKHAERKLRGLIG